MNIWKPEDIQPIGDGLAFDFRETAGPLTPPLYAPSGEAFRLYLKGFEMRYTVSAASPGYSGVSWEWDQDAQFAPRTYPPGNPWVPADVGDIGQMTVNPTNYGWAEDFTGQLGADGDKFPVLRWDSGAPEGVGFGLLPLQRMADWYPNDPRYVSAQLHRRWRRRAWNPSGLIPILNQPEVYGYGRIWSQPDGAGVSSLITDGFTVYEYYKLTLFEVQTPSFLADVASMVPLLVVPAVVMAMVTNSGSGGAIDSRAWRRKNGE